MWSLWSNRWPNPENHVSITTWLTQAPIQFDVQFVPNNIMQLNKEFLLN